MSTIVATATHDDQPREPGKPGIQVVRVADVTRTSQQVSILLSVLNVATPFLREDTEVGARTEIDEQAKISARDTFQLAHVRLRDIIDDQRRWTADDDMKPAFDALHAGQSKVAESEAELAKVRASAVKELRRPCRILNANVALFPVDGIPRWIAFLGQLPRENGLLGIGASPEEALENFDITYATQLSASPPPPPEPPEEPKRSKRKKKT